MPQPFTAILVVDILTHTLSDIYWDGADAAVRMEMQANPLLRFRGVGGGTLNWNKTGTFEIQVGYANGATSSVYQNGANVQNGAIDIQGITRLCLGSRGNGAGASAANVDIAEFMVYDSILSNANRQQIEQYLSDKYAIALV